MARVLELDEEIEREVDGVGDVFFSRLGEPVPLSSPPSSFDLSDPPRNPIAISFSARLLFVAMSQGFMVAETPEVIRMAKEIKEKGKGPSVSDSCFLDVKIGKVSILALSIDSLWLAAVVGCDVRFYSVENLRNKGSTFSFLCSIKSGVVKDFKWQKNTGDAFAILSSDGSLQLGQLQAPLKDVMNNVDAVDWSENGAFIAVARKNTLSIWSDDLKEQCQMKLLFQSWSDGTDSECSIRVDSVNWLLNNSIVIGCVRVYEDGKEEGYLVQVVAVEKLEFTERSGKPVVFSFPDLFEDISDDILPTGCGPYLFASYLKHLGLTLASFQKAIGAHLLLLRWSLDDDRREAVSLEYENEIYTPRIDLQENGNDNLILGFVVDQTPSNEKVRIKIEAEFKEVFPNCTLWCLTSEGKLILFHILRTSDDSYTPESSLSEDYRSVQERTPAALSLKHQLPAVTLGLNDSAEVKDSEPLQRLEKVSNSNDIVLTGKEVQGGANSNAQLYSGRILNAEKLPVVSSHMQDAGLVLAINDKICIQELSSCPTGLSVSTTLPVGNLSNEAFTTVQVGTRVLGQNVEMELAGSTGTQGSSFGSQSTGNLVFTSFSSAKSPSSALDRFKLGNAHSAKIGSENKLPPSHHGPISDDSLAGGKPFSWTVSSSLPPPSVFSENKTIQSEGAKSFLVKKGSPEPSPAMHKPLPIMPQSSVPGKSLNSMTHPSLNNSRNPRCPWMAEPEPELSKQFYNVKDMAKELDKLLLFIEREGGFRDACTISQESALSILEDGLKNLSIMSQVHKNKIEKQLLEIQQLQNKMLQVSTRQVYVEGLVKQASNDQYLDIWKRQRLSPELELKRQRILETYQGLTNQLIGLERHFNNLEISKFGEHGVHAGRRALHANADPSRNPQSVQKMYNTLNSQLAAAEQLSNCLSEQMAMLNINKQSVRHPTVVKELFESIGLPQDASIFHTPEAIKRTSVSASITKGNSKINTSSTSQILESGTARRRYSLDKSLLKFEPQKTTVKRMLKESGVSVIADKHVGRSREAFHSQTANYAIDLQKSNENHASSFSQPSSLKCHSLAYPTGKGIQEKRPKEASEPQSVSPFKWTLELSGTSQDLKSNSHPGQPLSSSLSSMFYNNPHDIADGKFQLPDSSSNIVIHTASQSGSSMVSKTTPSSKRTSNVPFNTSPQTSVAFPSSCTPVFKTTFPSEIVHEKTSGQLNRQSGKDAPTKLSVRSSDNFGVSEKGLFSLSDESSHSMQSVVQSVDGNRIAQVDALTGHSASPETSSTTPFNSLASAPAPIFSIKQSSTSLTSSLSSASISPIFPSLSINSSASMSSSYSPSSAMASIGKTSFDTKPLDDNNKTIPVPSSVLTPSTPPRLPPSNPLTVQSHESPVPQPSAIPFESAVSHSPPLQASIAKSNSESAPLLASKSEGLLQPAEISPLSIAAVSRAPVVKVSAGLSEGEPSVILTAGFSTFPPTSALPQIQSDTISPLSTIPQEKDEGIDLSSSQEDEMEEEAPSMANDFLGGLGGFGLGTASPHIPKSNPFGVSFNTAPASAPFSLTTSSGELFRPASFSIPPPKPIGLSQPTQSGAISSGFGGGFSGFGQPANIGAGQQALGSVLGAFGQSRQIGAGAQGAAGGFTGVVPGGGFAGAATGGGFVSATGGGFTGAATGGGFASAATGGGFAAAAAGGGFAAVGSKGGGFAAAASGGSGGFGGANPGGGFAGGGFGAFSSNMVGGFSGFGGNNAPGAGGPPSQLFTQIRK